MQDATAIIFLFALGSCIGSFLNVVVWRLPRGESLSHPPSHCPKCNAKLNWYDNLPVIGWLKLRGKCRHCGEPISPRYPIVEAITGLMFVFYYIMFFMTQTGPCAAPPRLLSLEKDWPMFVLYLVVLSALLAASLIDIELFLIPLQIPYFMAIVGVAVHTIIDSPGLPGSLIAPPLASAMAIGGGTGLLVSVVLLHFKIMPLSFPQGEVLEVDRELIQKDIDAAHERGDDPPEMPQELPRSQVRLEIGKEMLFLLPPMLGAILAAVILSQGEAQATWEHWLSFSPFAGFTGALLGALVGAFTVWIVRIIASLAFGRVAMGLGDVHLMFGVGAVIGGGASVVAFMLAPFLGIGYGLYRLLTGRGHELPYGPFLSLACGFTMLFYCPIYEYFRPGLEGLVMLLTGRLGQ